MTPPVWMNAVIRDFGLAAGANDFALNARGAAALNFANGVAFRLEYTGEELVMAMTTPWHGDTASLRRLMTFADPRARLGFKVRVALMSRSGRLLMAVRLAEREVTLPTMNAVFAALWRLVHEIGGAA